MLRSLSAEFRVPPVHRGEPVKEDWDKGTSKTILCCYSFPVTAGLRSLRSPAGASSCTKPCALKSPLAGFCCPLSAPRGTNAKAHPLAHLIYPRISSKICIKSQRRGHCSTAIPQSHIMSLIWISPKQERLWNHDPIKQQEFIFLDSCSWIILQKLKCVEIRAPVPLNQVVNKWNK